MKLDLGHINKLNAVTIKFLDDGIKFHAVKLRIKKGEIDIGKSKEANEFKDLKKFIGNKTPLVLHFLGKGILTKKTKESENYRHSLVLNANIQDFHFTDFIHRGEVLSSIVRYDLLKTVLNEIEEAKLDVVKVSAGPAVAALFIEFLEKNWIDSDDLKIKVSQDGISYSKIEDQARPTILGEESVDSFKIGAIATAAVFWMNPISVSISDVHDWDISGLEDARQRNIFYRFAFGVTVVFSLLLLGNRFYLSHLNKEIQENGLMILEFEDQLSELSFLESERERKEQLLSSSGLMNRKFLSYYLMEISSSVPEKITLTQVNIRPLTKDIKKRHKIEFHSDRITISGTTSSSDLLSNWIEELEAHEWMLAVDIIEYNFEKNHANFELELEIV